MSGAAFFRRGGACLSVRWPDWVLLLASAALMLAGPVMALEEWRAHEEAVAAEALTGLPPADPGFRAAWRAPLLGLVLVVSLLGTWSVGRVLARPVARAVSRRLVALLLAGMTVLDVAYLLDGTRLADAPPALRAATIAWAYPLAGFLIGGSAHRLAEVAERFGARAP